MKIIRYRAPSGGEDYGILAEDTVHRLVGDVFDQPSAGEAVGSLDDVQLLAPCEPSKLVCVGRNFAPHIEEMGEERPQQPFIFLKAPNTVVGPEAPVHRPSVARRFDYEGELAVVIGRRARGLAENSWAAHVLGYTCANDVTVRDWQSDGQWARAKGSDTFCPLGPWIVTDLAHPEDVAVRTRLNGDLRQDGRTSQFIFGIGAVLAFITEWITLEPGDVVLAGTPGGVGPMQSGDVVEVEVEGVGVLRNRVQ
jgi:2-keto-4-pentenoate hydratase/2-oxohepta-3-ene-1,7-dioic acid hydratase in catechol pathway